MRFQELGTLPATAIAGFSLLAGNLLAAGYRVRLYS